MSRIEELLQRKRADVDAGKALHTPVVPQDDRRVHWDSSPFRILAEIKRSSLSAGAIRQIPGLSSLANSYQSAGADVISVLTEQHYFHGSIEDLRSVRASVRVPLLQKDFVIDAYQILEAKEAGADFVLLIARFLSREQIQEYLALCEDIRINSLVEITDETDLRKVTMPLRFLGVNSRDLETLVVDTQRFERLRKYLPDAFLIAESGINSVETLQRVMDLGYHGALIGEHFLRAEDPAAEVRKFVNFAKRPDKTKVKICGITNESDARMAEDAGASALGFIFAESPRSIAVDVLKRFRQRLTIPCVGVFRGNPRDQIQSILQECDLDIAQTYDEQIRIEVPVWTARTFHSMEQLADIGIDRSNPMMLDIKVAEKDLPNAWFSLKDKRVFGLAGGLHADNVSQAISLCHPEWIDVARGVESSPGIKDPQKLNDFMKAVREHDAR